MIVFNGDALAVFLVGLVLLIPTGGLLWFDVIGEDTAMVSGSWSFFFASLIASLTGLKGRLFWIIPTWMVTLGLSIYISYENFQQFKSVALVMFLLFLFVIGLILLFLIYGEKKRIKKIERSVITLPIEGAEDYWEKIENLFFFPTFSKWTKNICDYNIKVLEALKEKEIILDTHQLLLDELINVKSNISRETKASINSDVEKLVLGELTIKKEQDKS